MIINYIFEQFEIITFLQLNLIYCITVLFGYFLYQPFLPSATLGGSHFSI